MKNKTVEAKQDSLEFAGRVVSCLPGARFVVELADNNHQITCTLSGKMRKNYIRLVRGDQVKVLMTPYDLEKGRIIFRQSSRVSPNSNRRWRR